VKICGVTRLEDARRVADAGAWALGMVFWPGSERRCTLAEAEQITVALRRRLELAGVFVNAPLDEVADLAGALGLSMVQLHGDEGPAYCAEVARRTGAKVIKAHRVRSRADLQALGSFHTDFHLLDAHVAGRWGGTGETFDWELAASRRSPIPLILSGGLTPDNVAEAIAVTRPWAVDVASGVEARPGVKDPAKLDAFIAAVAATASAGAPT
jgi:phosphoribosylanthranilate isomerase